jgi:hypothetical protein
VGGEGGEDTLLQLVNCYYGCYGRLGEEWEMSVCGGIFGFGMARREIMGLLCALRNV